MPRDIRKPFYNPLPTTLLVLVLFAVNALLIYYASSGGIWLLLFFGSLGMLIALLPFLIPPKSRLSLIAAFLLVVIVSSVSGGLFQAYLMRSRILPDLLRISGFLQFLAGLVDSEYELSVVLSIILGIGFALSFLGLLALAQQFRVAFTPSYLGFPYTPGRNPLVGELVSWSAFFVLVSALYLLVTKVFLQLEPSLSQSSINPNFVFFPIFLLPLTMLAYIVLGKLRPVWSRREKPTDRMFFEEDFTDAVSEPVEGVKLHLAYNYLPVRALGHIIESIGREYEKLLRETISEVVRLSGDSHLWRPDRSREVYHLERRLERDITLEVRAAFTGTSLDIFIIVGMFLIGGTALGGALRYRQWRSEATEIEYLQRRSEVTEALKYRLPHATASGLRRALAEGKLEDLDRLHRVPLNIEAQVHPLVIRSREEDERIIARVEQDTSRRPIEVPLRKGGREGSEYSFRSDDYIQE